MKKLLKDMFMFAISTFTVLVILSLLIVEVTIIISGIGITGYLLFGMGAENVINTFFIWLYNNGSRLTTVVMFVLPFVLGRLMAKAVPNVLGESKLHKDYNNVNYVNIFDVNDIKGYIKNRTALAIGTIVYLVFPYYVNTEILPYYTGLIEQGRTLLSHYYLIFFESLFFTLNMTVLLIISYYANLTKVPFTKGIESRFKKFYKRNKSIATPILIGVAIMFVIYITSFDTVIYGLLEKAIGSSDK